MSSISHKKPTIVLVPGASQLPSTYDPILPGLHAAGYKTTAVALASTGARTPVKFEDDVAPIRSVVSGLVELGREVVVVSHSYGAVPATEALRGLTRKDRNDKRLDGGVIQLVYIAGIVPTQEATCADAYGPMVPKEEGGSWMQFEDLGNGFTSIKNGEECFYHDLPPDLAKYHASLLQTQYHPASLAPLTYEAYRDIPAAFLYCTDDRAFPIHNQMRVVSTTGIERTGSLDTSHSPFLSKPEGVVGFIREVVEG
ncbi:Alpha/beta hydrolase fold-1 [Aspergillus californicus]